mgnify:CR=1 FL=1
MPESKQKNLKQDYQDFFHDEQDSNLTGIWLELMILQILLLILFILSKMNVSRLLALI